MNRKTFLFCMGFMLCFTADTMSLSLEDIIKLKEAGVSDETIQLLIAQEAELRERSLNPYREFGIREFQGAEGDQSTIYSTGQDIRDDEREERIEEEDRERSWDILDHLIIDERSWRKEY
jgi:hypothetical protein